MSDQTFKVGQEVRFVFLKGHWRSSYYNEEWFHQTGHDWHLGHVVSADVETVAIWAQNHNGECEKKGMKMFFVPIANVFNTDSFDTVKDRIAQLNLEWFGHKDGEQRRKT